MKALAAALTVVSIALIGASPASADTECQLNGGVLEIDYTDGPSSNGGQATLSRSSGGGANVTVTQGNTTVCTTPIGNVNSIDWDDLSTDSPNEFFIDLSNGAFIKPLVLGDNEIPIDIAAGGQLDLVLINGGDGAERVNYGTQGANLNAGETTALGNAIDEDLTFSGVEEHTANGRNGNDIISGAGGAGNGTEFTTALAFSGNSGDDALTGGNGEDDLSGDSSFDVQGNDALTGGGANDDLFSAGGNDSFDPGAGTTDDLFFISLATGITLDLAKAGPQQTGVGTMTVAPGIDRVIGSFHDDTLLGTAAPEELIGQDGDDVIVGRGGSDQLAGDIGDDTLLPRDGVVDDVGCGPDNDRVAVELGTPDPDTINADCEIRTKIDTSIASGPGAKVAARTGVFRFASNETGVTFECSLDGKPFGGCPSPFTTPLLPDGQHSLAVRARDRLGFADSSAAARAWSIDATAPVLAALTVSRKTFRLGRGATPLAAAKRRRKAKRGTRISFTASEAGSARIVVTPLLKGRRVGKRCLKATRKRRKRKSCTRLGRPTTLTRAVKAGTNNVPFTGRLGRKALKAGRYRIEVSLADALGNRSPAQRLIVRIVK